MKLLEKIDEKELGAVVSRWTGNDASGNFNVVKVNVTKTRDLVLHWRKSKHVKPVLVGHYRMYPENLIKEGYCREVGGKIVVSLFRQSNGHITISQKRDDRKKIDVGKVAYLGSEQ